MKGRTGPGAPLTPEEMAFAHSLVLHKDAHVLVLNKPAGLSSQGGRIAARTLDDLMAAFAKPSGVRPRLVHRLDRDTSGVLLTARSQPDAAFLGKAMMARRMAKTYLAVVAPSPHPGAGLIDAPLRRREVGREAYVSVTEADDPEGRVAVTHYRTLAANDRGAVVELRPRTGRMHQLRAHLAHIGAPIAGDPRYGGALTLGGAPVPRLMLHAVTLTFPHPAGGEMTIAAPIPADLAALLERVKLTLPEAWVRPQETTA